MEPPAAFSVVVICVFRSAGVSIRKQGDVREQEKNPTCAEEQHWRTPNHAQNSDP